MGVSTDAILAFGFDLDDEKDAEWERPCPFRGEPTKTLSGEACSACGLRESDINDTAVGVLVDGWSRDQPNADGRWLWREGGKEHREVELVLCGGGAEVADPDDDTEESSQIYWCRTPTDQKNMPGLWKRPLGVLGTFNDQQEQPR